MEQTSQQRFEDKNYQLRAQLDATLDAQLANKKEQYSLEEFQEQFFHLQQQEQALYQRSLYDADPEERVFFEERQDEGLLLSQKTFRELEEEQDSLEQEYRSLLKEEDSVREAQRMFLKTEGKERTYGA